MNLLLYKRTNNLPQPIKALIVTAILLVLLPVSRTDALEGVSLGVAPALISVEAEKGKNYIYPVTVFNKGSKPVDVSVKFQDFQLDPYGKVRFLPRQAGTKSWSASTWLSVPDRDFSLKPGEEKDVQVLIEPPRNAEAGTHRAIISFGTIHSKTRKGELPIRASVATLALISVAGKTRVVPHLNTKIPGLVFTIPTINVTVRNTGNTHFFTDGQVRFLSRSGKSISKYALKTPEQGALVLPRARRDFKVEWKGAPYFGFFTAETKVKTTGGKELLERENFILVRWQLLLALSALIILGIGVYLLPKRFKIVKRQ